MTLSRKEFLTRGLVAFGHDLVQSVRGAMVPAETEPAGEVFGPLTVDNRHCLAQQGGCFACIDHCPRHAINIRLGVGIAVDTEKCDGCGACAVACPLAPRVISMKPLATT